MYKELPEDSGGPRRLPKNIYDRGSKGFEAVVWHDGIRDHSRCFPSPREAEEYLTLQRADRIRDQFIPRARGKVTLQERFDWWDKHGSTDLRASSKARDVAYSRHHILPAFGPIPIMDITPPMVQAWVSELIARRLAASTVHKIHGILSKILKEAAGMRYIAINPCEFTKLPEIVVEEMMFLDYDQVQDLVDAIDPRYAAAVRLGAYTGLRAGELFGLRVRDVLRDGFLHVRRQNVSVSGKVLQGVAPKTAAGTRMVPMPRMLANMIADHLKNRDPDNLVFVAPHGGPVRLDAWRWRFWYPACVKAEVGQLVTCRAGDPDGHGGLRQCPICGETDPARRAARAHYEGLRIHDLRHTAVSFWIDKGRGLFEISKMIGQRDLKLLETRYGHLIDRKHDQANEDLDQEMADALARKRGSTANVSPFRRRRRFGADAGVDDERGGAADGGA